MKLDRYEVLCREDGAIHRLGSGPTSSTYKALDLDLRTPVVLRVIRDDLAEGEVGKERFLREARAAAMLRHANVAQIYRLGEENGVCFYAREFVEGETLEAKVQREGPLPIAIALKIALQVASALVAVKRMNLVHRDIKPSNLMFTPEEEVKIIDFGTAKSSPSADGSGASATTLSGFHGTPEYASPEQLDEQPLGVASDIYSLGVTLWFLLCGRPPFRGPAAQVMARHLQCLPPFDELSIFPTPVVSLLAHMLEKDPARRPLSPTALVGEIEETIERAAGGAAPAAVALPAPELQPALTVVKMTASRERVPQRPRSFFLAEVLIGALIALIIYFVLSRPVEPLTVPSKEPVAAAPATQEAPPARTAAIVPRSNSSSGE